MFCFNTAKRREREAKLAEEKRAYIRRVAEQGNCGHRDWYVFGYNPIGYASCKHCGKLIGMDDCLNIMKAQFDEAIARLNKAPE